MYYIDDYTTPDGTKVPLRSNYAQKNFYQDLNTLSVDNPYAPFLASSHNKTDYKRLLTESIQWEANIKKNELDMANTRQLREDAVLSDVVAKRKAGINPDIAGVGGGTGGGGTSAPTIDGTDLSDLNTPIENAQTAAGVISSVASFASAMTGGFASITDTIQSIRNFDNVLNISKATARTAEAGADVAEATAVDQKILSRMQSALNIVKSFPVKKGPDGASVIPTLDEVSSFITDFGIQGDPGTAKLVHGLMQNPELEAMYNDAIHRSNKARSDAMFRSLDFYNQLNQFNKASELCFARSSFYSGQIKERVNSILSRSDFAENVASNMQAQEDVFSQDLQNQHASLELEAEQIQRDITAWHNSMKAICDRKRDLEAKLAKYSSDPAFSSSPEGRTEIARILLAISDIDNRGAQEIGTINDLMLQVESRGYIIESTGLLGQKSSYVNPVGSSVLTNDYTQRNRNALNYWNLTFQDYYNDPDRWGASLQTAISGAFELAGIALNKKNAGNSRGYQRNRNVYPRRSLDNALR